MNVGSAFPCRYEKASDSANAIISKLVDVSKVYIELQKRKDTIILSTLLNREKNGTIFWKGAIDFLINRGESGTTEPGFKSLVRRLQQEEKLAEEEKNLHDMMLTEDGKK